MAAVHTYRKQSRSETTATSSSLQFPVKIHALQTKTFLGSSEYSSDAQQIIIAEKLSRILFHRYLR